LHNEKNVRKKKNGRATISQWIRQKYTKQQKHKTSEISDQSKRHYDVLMIILIIKSNQN
jgi:hypothetical protein